jgi:hypothetical protein
MATAVRDAPISAAWKRLLPFAMATKGIFEVAAA